MNDQQIKQKLLFMRLGREQRFDYANERCVAVKTLGAIGRCNRVCNNAPIVEQDIIDIQNYYAGFPFTWVVDAADEQTIRLLENHGLSYKNTVPVMALNLKHHVAQSPNDNVCVKEVASREDFEAWIFIVSSTYHYNEIELEKSIDDLRDREPHGSVRLFLGLCEGKAVSASMMVYHHDSVSLHLVSTLEHYRGRGFGYEIINEPLLNAAELGCATALLTSSQMGFNLAKRLGFNTFAHYVIYGNY